MTFCAFCVCTFVFEGIRDIYVELLPTMYYFVQTPLSYVVQLRLMFALCLISDLRIFEKKKC